MVRSVEELVALENIKHICPVCGKEWIGAYHFLDECDVCSCKCYKEKYWKIIEDEQDEHIIINGVCYYDKGYSNSKKLWTLGYSGRPFRIRMNTGKEILTNNLWLNGTVPENHRDKLKDNAVFVKV